MRRLVPIAVGACLLLTLGVWLAHPAVRATGSNSVAPNVWVVDAPPGTPVCVRGLRLPAGTSGLKMRLRTQEKTPVRAIATVRKAGQQRKATVVLQPQKDPNVGRFATFSLPPTEAEGPAEVCVEGSGALGLAGQAGVSPGLPGSAFIRGQPAPFRVAVSWVDSRKVSQFSVLDEGAKRAALFKPGFVGPWTFAAIAILIPLLWLAGLWLLSREEPARLRSLLAAVAAIAFLNAAAWALLTPAYQGPDEFSHAAYSTYLGETGKLPLAGANGKYASSEEIAVLENTRAFALSTSRRTKPPWLPEDERLLQSRLDRERPARDDGDGGELASVVHGPGYYAVAAVGYRLAGGSPFDRLFGMRVASALLGALAAMFALLAARELLPRQRWAWMAAGLLVAFQPMASFMSGVVNADAGVNAAGAALIWLLVRALRQGLTARLALAIAGVFALGVVAKAAMLSLGPALVVAGIVLALRGGTGRRAWIAVGGAAAAGLLAVAVAPPLRDGAQTLLDAGPVTGGGGLGTTLSWLWQVFLPPLPFMTDLWVGGATPPAFGIYVKGATAAFGWTSLVFPAAVYRGLLLLGIGVVGLGVAAWVRRREAVGSRLGEIAVLATAVASVALFMHLQFVPQIPVDTIGEQGRYLFPALAAIAVLALGACFGAGRRGAPAVATLLVSVSMALCGLGQLLVFTTYYT